MLTWKTSAFPTGPEKQLFNDVAIEDGSLWLASQRHIENSEESSKAFLKKPETLARNCGDQYQQKPTESKGHPEEDCQLHGQRNVEIKLTLTPMKQERRLDPAGPLTLGILKGSYARKLLSQRWFIIKKIKLISPLPKILYQDALFHPHFCRRQTILVWSSQWRGKTKF